MPNNAKVVLVVADDSGFLGPGIPDLVTEVCPHQDTAQMLREVIQKRRDAYHRAPVAQNGILAPKTPGWRIPAILF